MSGALDGVPEGSSAWPKPDDKLAETKKEEKGTIADFGAGLDDSARIEPTKQPTKTYDKAVENADLKTRELAAKATELVAGRKEPVDLDAAFFAEFPVSMADLPDDIEVTVVNGPAAAEVKEKPAPSTVRELTDLERKKIRDSAVSMMTQYLAAPSSKKPSVFRGPDGTFAERGNIKTKSHQDIRIKAIEDLGLMFDEVRAAFEEADRDFSKLDPNLQKLALDLSVAVPQLVESKDLESQKRQSTNAAGAKLNKEAKILLCDRMVSQLEEMAEKGFPPGGVKFDRETIGLAPTKKANSEKALKGAENALMAIYVVGDRDPHRAMEALNNFKNSDWGKALAPRLAGQIKQVETKMLERVTELQAPDLSRLGKKEQWAATMLMHMVDVAPTDANKQFLLEKTVMTEETILYTYNSFMNEEQLFAGAKACLELDSSDNPILRSQQRKILHFVSAWLERRSDQVSGSENYILDALVAAEENPSISEEANQVWDEAQSQFRMRGSARLQRRPEETDENEVARIASTAKEEYLSKTRKNYALASKTSEYQATVKEVAGDIGRVFSSFRQAIPMGEAVMPQQINPDKKDFTPAKAELTQCFNKASEFVAEDILTYALEGNPDKYMSRVASAAKFWTRVGVTALEKGDFDTARVIQSALGKTEVHRLLLKDEKRLVNSKGLYKNWNTINEALSRDFSFKANRADARKKGTCVLMDVQGPDLDKVDQNPKEKQVGNKTVFSTDKAVMLYDLAKSYDEGAAHLAETFEAKEVKTPMQMMLEHHSHLSVNPERDRDELSRKVRPRGS